MKKIKVNIYTVMMTTSYDPGFYRCELVIADSEDEAIRKVQQLDDVEWFEDFFAIDVITKTIRI